MGDDWAVRGVRRQVIPGTAVIWTWHGSSDRVAHEVRCLLSPLRTPSGATLASAGEVLYTVWAGERPSLPASQQGLRGPAQAEDLIRRLRRHGADALRANRHLASAGQAATEHADRPDCTCMDCPAGQR